MADLSITDSQPLPAGSLSIAKSEPLPQPRREGDLGPSPGMAKIGNTIFHDLSNLPAGVMAFIRHPIDTTKAVVGQMDLEHPENSSGLLGLPDTLAREWESGHKAEALAHLTEAAAPALAEAGPIAKAVSAAGDSTAATALLGAAKGAVKAIPRAAETSVLKYTGVPQLARGAITGAREALAARLTKAMGSFQDAETLEGLAQSQLGKKFSNATPEEQASIRDIAARLQNPAPATPAARPVQPGRPPMAQAAPVPEVPGKTIADIAREELTPPAAQAPPEVPAAAPQVPPTAAPAGPVQVIPPKRSLAQVEAAMAQKAPGPIEAPRSMYTAAGDLKSPQLRAQEIINANRIAKAQRFAAALHEQGIEPSEIMKIPMGTFAEGPIMQGASPVGWGNIANLLGEKAPSADTVNAIYTEMQRLKKAGSAVSKKPGAAEIAAKLKAEMERSGTITPPDAQ